MLSLDGKWAQTTPDKPRKTSLYSSRNVKWGGYVKSHRHQGFQALIQGLVIQHNFFSFEISSDLNQAVPNHLADESQTR